MLSNSMVLLQRKINGILGAYRRWRVLGEDRYGYYFKRRPNLKCPVCGQKLRFVFREVPHGECGNPDCYIQDSIWGECPNCGFNLCLEVLWEL